MELEKRFGLLLNLPNFKKRKITTKVWGIRSIKHEGENEMNFEELERANIEETARLASNYSIAEQIAVAAVLDTEVMENELIRRRRECEADLQALRKIANRQKGYM